MMAALSLFRRSMASLNCHTAANPGRSAKCLPGSFDPRRLSSSRARRARTPVVSPSGRGAQFLAPERAKDAWSGGG